MNLLRPILLLLFCIQAAKVCSQQKKENSVLILISIDGFRHDYIEKYQPPALSALAAKGTRAAALIPSYPTKTFTNHYSIVTGLYPDHHGIIENNMYDSTFDAVFKMENRKEVGDGRWWLGEPVWVTAEKQGIKTASFFWPGTEAEIGGVRPTLWKTYDHHFPNNQRVDSVLAWLELEQRPRFISLYFSDVDDIGHAHGPDAAETRAAVHKVDSSIARLVEGIHQRKLGDQVNLIIVSDHGMTAWKPSDAIVLDRLIDTSLIERIFWVGEFTQIFPKKGKLELLEAELMQKLPAAVKIYRPGSFPSRWHFGRSPRIAPLVLVPDEGILVLSSQRYERYRKEGKLEKIMGSHGADNALPSMHGIFIASGNAFRKNYRTATFENIHIYQLMCRLLKIEPAPNDGSYRLVKKMLRRSAR